mgnify:CR=1 FL=1
MCVCVRAFGNMFEIFISSCISRLFSQGVTQDGLQVLLGQYSYDLTGPTVQTYPKQTADENTYSRFKFSIVNNYGDDEHTCIYRVRIHGDVLP